MNEKLRKTLLGAAFILWASSSIALLIAGCKHISNKEWRETASDFPDTNWIEEDLEPTFMTTGVCILDWEGEIDYKNYRANTYYLISANGWKYKVHYTIKQDSLFNFSWKMNNYIQVSNDEEYL